MSRAYRRQDDRRIRVRGERRDPPDAHRLSKALLAQAQELQQAQAEADAQKAAMPVDSDERTSIEEPADGSA